MKTPHRRTVERADCPACRECGMPACLVCTANHRPHAYRPSMWQYVCGACWESEWSSLHPHSEDPTD